MYFGAEHLIGFFTVVPSAQWYSYLDERGESRKSGKKEERGLVQPIPVSYFLLE